MKQLLLVTCLSLCQCFAVANAEDNGIKNLLGKRVSEGVEILHLKLDESFVVDEPPCVPRGIKGKISSGAEVTLLVRRGDVPFRESCKWVFEEFANKRIIGVMLTHGETMIVYGEIPIPWGLGR